MMPVVYKHSGFVSNLCKQAPVVSITHLKVAVWQQCAKHSCSNVYVDFDKTLLWDGWSYVTWGPQKHGCMDRPASLSIGWSHGCGWHPAGSSPGDPPGCAPGPMRAHPPAPLPSGPRPPAAPLQPCPSARPPGTGGACAHPEPPVQLTPVSACAHSQRTLWPCASPCQPESVSHASGMHQCYCHSLEEEHC